MLTKDLLVDYLASKNLSQRDKVLLILFADDGIPLTISIIRDTALSYGLREITRWNIARILSESSKGLAVKVPEGWTLTPSGRKSIKEQFLPDDPASIRETAVNLRKHLDKISNIYTREFVEESIECLEADLKRSAVVMSWAGAMSVLYDYVIANRLADFNTKAKDVKKDWKPAVTRDELAHMSESKFLDTLANLSIIGKNTKEQLQNGLRLRNSCAHPSSFTIGEHTVKSHIEILILNVYEKF